MTSEDPNQILKSAAALPGVGRGLGRALGVARSNAVLVVAFAATGCTGYHGLVRAWQPEDLAEVAGKPWLCRMSEIHINALFPVNFGNGIVAQTGYNTLDISAGEEPGPEEKREIDAQNAAEQYSGVKGDTTVTNCRTAEQMYVSSKPDKGFAALRKASREAAANGNPAAWKNVVAASKANASFSRLFLEKAWGDCACAAYYPGSPAALDG